MGEYLKNRSPVDANGKAAARMVTDNWMSVHPALSEYLTLDRWEDGTERETATLLLFAEDGLWKACLHDRAEGRTAWVSSGTVTGLLERLEEGCASDDLEWRKRVIRNFRK
jgi:hypothetical protein